MNNQYKKKDYLILNSGRRSHFNATDIIIFDEIDFKLKVYYTLLLRRCTDAKKNVIDLDIYILGFFGCPNSGPDLNTREIFCISASLYQQCTERLNLRNVAIRGENKL